MSNLFAYSMVFLTILLTVYAQFVVKWRVVSAGLLPASWTDRTAHMFSLVLDPWVITAFMAAFLASVTWMFAMTRLQISHAYPMTALTFVIVVIGGAFLFNEPLTTPKIAGIALIVIGIYVGSQG